MRFYLGTHRPYWLWDRRFTDVPLFISHRQLSRRVTPFPRAFGSYAVDSGAFTELTTHGRWTTTAAQYVAALRRYAAELGPFDFAAQQDSMCEDFVLAKVSATAGRTVTVTDQQRATVANFLTLRDLAPDLPIAPTLQGYAPADYERCAQMFADAGIDLAAEPVVGVGSVCRRDTPAQIEVVLRTVAGLGVAVHGFGVKTEGLTRAGHLLASADSLAWSYAARRETGRIVRCCTGPSGCRNCPAEALRWRTATLANLANRQLSLTDDLPTHTRPVEVPA